MLCLQRARCLHVHSRMSEEEMPQRARPLGCISHPLPTIHASAIVMETCRRHAQPPERESLRGLERLMMVFTTACIEAALGTEAWPWQSVPCHGNEQMIAVHTWKNSGSRCMHAQRRKQLTTHLASRRSLIEEMACSRHLISLCQRNGRAVPEQDWNQQSASLRASKLGSCKQRKAPFPFCSRKADPSGLSCAVNSCGVCGANSAAGLSLTAPVLRSMTHIC